MAAERYAEAPAPIARMLCPCVSAVRAITTPPPPATMLVVLRLPRPFESVADGQRTGVELFVDSSRTWPTAIANTSHSPTAEAGMTAGVPVKNAGIAVPVNAPCVAPTGA